MIGMDADSLMNHRDQDIRQVCIRLCQDCADICALSAQWMSRLSSSADMLHRVCADMCDRCAETCELHALTMLFAATAPPHTAVAPASAREIAGAGI
jgi:ferredoxin